MKIALHLNFDISFFEVIKIEITLLTTFDMYENVLY